jgi:O-antigen/teichoic acid export membrane protein
MEKPRDHLVRGTAHKLAGIVVKSAAPVLTIALAHFFSREAFGAYVSLQLLALTLSRFCLLGLDKGIAWRLPQNAREGRDPHDQLGPAFGTAMRTGLLVALTASAAVVLLLQSAPAGLGAIRPAFAFLCLASIPPLVAVHYLGSALEGVFQPKYRVWIGEFSLYAAVPPIAIALRASGVGDIALPLAFLSSSMLGAVMMLLVARRRFGIGAMRRNGGLDPALRRYAWPQGISDLVSSVLLRLDLWMILWFLGPELAAVYAIMLTLSNAVRTIRQSFDSLLLPVISGMAHDDQRAKLAPAFGFTVGIVTIIQFFIALAVFFFPGEILSIAGRDYAVETQALLILLVGNLITGYFGLNAQVLAGLGKSAALMRQNLWVLALNFALNLWWIPLYGLTGAAAATAVAFLAQNLRLHLMQRRISGLALYSRPLWAQFALILAFAVCAFLLFPMVEPLPWTVRAAAFVAATLAYAPFALHLRRRTALPADF